MQLPDTSAQQSVSMDYSDGAQALASDYEDALPQAEQSSFAKLIHFAQFEGDISGELTEQQLITLGSDVVDDYERDNAARSEWLEDAKRSLDLAAQEKSAASEVKNYPFDGASDVNYPILTVAALQFAARAYPAIIKGDEAVNVKVLGLRQFPAPPPLPPGMPPEQAQALQAQVQQLQQMVEARWADKERRAARVKEYMNDQLFYDGDDWEGDTDALLHTIPLLGCAFRKRWYDPVVKKNRSAFISPLNLVVPQSAKNLATTPRITEEIPDVYPYQIKARQRSGQYRAKKSDGSPLDVLSEEEDKQTPRKLLEQHRLEDLDGDGLEEPYIVTVDFETRHVLRVETAYGVSDIQAVNGKVVAIKRQQFYVKYPFFPDPKGRFYDIGFGQLLKHIVAALNTSINQLLDAGRAQNAGGGFISSGLRLQNAGQTNVIRWKPGEYKVVNASGQTLQQAIYERTTPAPSNVLFELLGLLMDASKDIASIKDVITGDSPPNQTATATLALIEQGLQVFTAIYKRVYRALKQEFALLFESICRYGDQQDYMNTVDSQDADVRKDFAADDMDIRPISDPTAVTHMQQLSKAQFLGQFLGKGLNDGEIYRRMFAAANIDDIDTILQSPGPNPQVVAEVDKTKSETDRNKAETMLTLSKAADIHANNDPTFATQMTAANQPIEMPQAAE